MRTFCNVTKIWNFFEEQVQWPNLGFFKYWDEHVLKTAQIQKHVQYKALSSTTWSV